MSKKIRYSEPLAQIWDAYNESQKIKPISYQDFIYQWIYRDMNNPFYPSNSYTQAHIFVAEMFYSDATKQMLHLFFIDSYLRDFLMEMPINDFQGLTQYIIDNGVKRKSGAISLLGSKTDELSNISNYSFGIHIPYENKYKGYAFDFTYDYNTKQLLFCFAVDKGCSYINLNNYEELLKKKTPDSEKSLQYLRLAINTIIYMDTFPNCVVDGTPDEIKNDYCKKITIAEKVLESTSDKSVRPHFRRGYFKRLTSDFYTRMKGKTVFVSPTMVNGVSKTIYTAGNLEEFAE